MSNYIERYWRDATPQDAIREPPMVARFRDDEKYAWRINLLRGIRQGAEFPWFSETKGSFEYCQVYDAPNPGDGWRLIDIKYEQPQEGDEVLSLQGWKKRLFHFCFEQDAHYRRRIEQPKTEPKYVPFEWEDREQLKSRWIQYSSKGQAVVEVCVKFTNDEDGFLINDTYNYWLLDNATFLDTGEPVGKRVQ